MKKKYTAFLISLILAYFLLNVNGFESMAKEKSVPLHRLEASTLHILTRHDFTITNEFTSEFLASDYAINNGITEIVYYSATTDEGWKNLLQDPTKSIDIAWGGGVETFSLMENYGLLKHIDNSTLKSIINSSVPDEIANTNLKKYDSSGDLIWFGNAISSFGLIVNHDYLTTYGLPVPSTWDELASLTYYINPSEKSIGIADPTLSTVNTKNCQIILQASGWEDGWSILTRIGANAGIYSSIIVSRSAVISGDIGISMSIDFYGIIAHRENPNCEYIIPDNQSAIIPSPIALAKNIDNQIGADAFIEFLVSPEGQSVWLHDGLDRLPVNEYAFHTLYGQTRIDLYNLFNETRDNVGINFNATLAKSYETIVNYYFHETITNEYSRLRNIWGEMISQLIDGNITANQFNSYVDDLGETFYTEQEAIDANAIFISDPGTAAAMQTEWRSYAANKYDSIYEQLIISIPEINSKNDITYLFLFMILTVPLIRKKLKRKH